MRNKEYVCSDRSHPYVCPHPARIEFPWLVVFELNCGGTCWFSYSSNRLKSVRVGVSLMNSIRPILESSELSMMVRAESYLLLSATFTYSYKIRFHRLIKKGHTPHTTRTTHKMRPTTYLVDFLAAASAAFAVPDFSGPPREIVNFGFSYSYLGKDVLTMR